MGQSVHPISFRIPYIRRWKAIDFPSSLNKNNLFNDLQIKNYLENIYFYNKYLIDEPLFVRDGQTLKIFYTYFLRKVKLQQSSKVLKKKLKSPFINKKKFNTIKSKLKIPLKNTYSLNNIQLLTIINNLLPIIQKKYLGLKHTEKLEYTNLKTKLFATLQKNKHFKKKILARLKIKKKNKYTTKIITKRLNFIFLFLSSVLAKKRINAVLKLETTKYTLFLEKILNLKKK